MQRRKIRGCIIIEQQARQRSNTMNRIMFSIAVPISSLRHTFFQRKNVRYLIEKEDEHLCLREERIRCFSFDIFFFLTL